MDGIEGDLHHIELLSKKRKLISKIKDVVLAKLTGGTKVSLIFLLPLTDLKGNFTKIFAAEGLSKISSRLPCLNY